MDARASQCTITVGRYDVHVTYDVWTMVYVSWYDIHAMVYMSWYGTGVMAWLSYDTGVMHDVVVIV